jgi:hypothetical protein
LAARSLALLIALAVAALAAACGSSLPTPETGVHPRDYTTFVEVPYPPPPARVEFVPPKPADGAVWVDGQWDWEGKRWVWLPGGWVMPPANGYFAPWVTVRRVDGKLFFAKASWHDRSGTPIAEPKVLAPAASGTESPAAAPPPAPTLTTPPPPLGSPDAGPVPPEPPLLPPSP